MFDIDEFGLFHYYCSMKNRKIRKWIKQNVKKVLALVLAFACAFTMFAGAAFTDAADIEAAEAVDTLVALGVIDGYDDGSFRPDATVTRAEMAKMIYVIRTNRSDASAYNDDATTFTDINGHWARGYIKYCQSLGVISGKSTTKFDPDATVTTQEAAKMLLVTLGYNSEKAGMEGSGWAQKTTALADENGLLVDVNCGTTQGMPRQYAAQLIYNAIQAYTVQWRDDAYYNTNVVGRPNETIGARYMDLVISEGILTSSGKYAYTGAVAGTDKVRVSVEKVDGVKQAAAPTTFDYEDVDLTGLAGEYVKVLSNKKTGEVYGVASMSDKNTVIETTTDKAKDRDTDSVKVDGTEYDLDANFNVYGTMADTAADQVKFVDNNKDGDLDLAIVVPVGVAKVTFVGTDSITMTKTLGSANLKSVSQKTADMIVYDGVAKDDYVVFQKDLYTQKDMIIKADVIEGTITGQKGAPTVNEWQINGSWYKIFGDATTYAPGSYTPVSGDTVKAVAIGSKLYYVEKTDGANGAKDVVMVVNYATASGLDKDRAVMLKSDGTKVTAEYKMMSGAIGVGALYTFKVNNDGVYELTPAANMTDYTYVAPVSSDVDLVNDKVGAYAISDEAVVYVISQTAQSASTAAKVVTGKELKGFTTGATNATISVDSLGFYYSKVNGINKASIIAVKLGAADTTLDNLVGTSSANYGYLVDDAYGSTENGKDYVNFQLWNGSETISVKWETNTAASGFAKHDVIGYDDMGNGQIKNVTSLSMTPAALTGGAGSDAVQFNNAGTIYDITSDTVVLYVNGSASDAANIGVQGGSMSNALEPATGIFVQNVAYKVKSGNDLEVLVVDVNNRIETRVKGNLTSIAGLEVSVNNVVKATGAGTVSNVIATGDVVTVKNTSGASKTVTFDNIIGGTFTFTLAAGATTTVTTNSTTLTIS